MNSNQGSMTSDLIVYVAILALACVQVFVLKGHLFAMLSVAIVQAILAVTFFMHLGSEKRGFLIFVAVFTIFVLLTLQYGWTDSYRMVTGAPFSK